MSIFKETFRDFVFNQLTLRKEILKTGNKGDSRFSGRSRVSVPQKGGTEKKVTIDAGAFYTNTISKQCVIRMCSGVDIKDEEDTKLKVFEGAPYEKSKDLKKEGLAIRYILEGGVPTKDADFSANAPLSNETKVIPRGRGKNRGFGKSYGSPYGDPYLRSDAKDGFGIVPMPGIVDADIRTKTAYGSLREAKVKFKCHNRRQLEILELLYMRPGYPILLEWGWSPYIDNTGKRQNNFFGYIPEFFSQNSTPDIINSKIVSRKIQSGGNYDALFGYCKNFEIVARPDGGYDCSTEIIAMGDCLQGLKGVRTGLTMEDLNGDSTEMDDFEFILKTLQVVSLAGDVDLMNEIRETTDQELEFYKELHKDTDDEAIIETLQKHGSTRNNIANIFVLAQMFNHYGITKTNTDTRGSLDTDTGYSNSELENLEVVGYLKFIKQFNKGTAPKDQYLPGKEGTIFEGTIIFSSTHGLLVGTLDSSGEITKFQKIDEFKSEEGERRVDDTVGNMKKTLEKFMIYQNQPLTDDVVKIPRFWAKDKTIVSAAVDDYIRWDFLVTLLNKIIIESGQVKKNGSTPLVQFSCFRDPISSEGGLEYLKYSRFQFNDEEVKRFNAVDDNNNIVRLEDIADISIDPKVCLLPHQIPKITDPILEGYKKSSIDVDNKSIGMIYLNLKYLITTYNELRYSEDGINESFNLLDFFKKVWEQDVNDACAGTKNFMLQTEIERPDVVRVIDMTSQSPKNLVPKDLFTFDIQSNEAIVRDFNYNTTLPSALGATVAVAAQAPRSISTLDQATFAKFNKFTENRFSLPPDPYETDPVKTASELELEQKKAEKLRKTYEKDTEKLQQTIIELKYYSEFLLFGQNKDDANTGENDLIATNVAKGYIKGLESRILSILSRYPANGQDDFGKPFTKGQYRPVPKTGNKSAVIPLKFNAMMDGIAGMVIGNVFKVEKNKLPIGYQADEIAFVVMSEKQKITSGQDWTTAITGQLILLDLEQAETLTEEEKKEQKREKVDKEEKEAIEKLDELGLKVGDVVDGGEYTPFVIPGNGNLVFDYPLKITGIFTKPLDDRLGAAGAAVDTYNIGAGAKDDIYTIEVYVEEIGENISNLPLDSSISHPFRDEKGRPFGLFPKVDPDRPSLTEGQIIYPNWRYKNADRADKFENMGLFGYTPQEIQDFYDRYQASDKKKIDKLIPGKAGTLYYGHYIAMLPGIIGAKNFKEGLRIYIPNPNYSGANGALTTKTQEQYLELFDQRKLKLNEDGTPKYHTDKRYF